MGGYKSKPEGHSKGKHENKGKPHQKGKPKGKRPYRGARGKRKARPRRRSAEALERRELHCVDRLRREALEAHPPQEEEESESHAIGILDYEGQTTVIDT